MPFKTLYSFDELRLRADQRMKVREAQPSKQVALFALIVVAGHICLHYVVEKLPLSSLLWSNFWGWLVLATAHGLSIAACLWIANRETPAQRTRWQLFAVSIGLQLFGVFFYLLRALAFPSTSHSPGLPIYFLLASAIPLYFALSISLDHTETLVVQRLDIASAIAMSLLLLALVYCLMTPAGARGPRQAQIVDLIFDVKNVYLAGFAVVRLIGARTRQSRRFFGSAFVIFAIAAIIDAIRNRAINHHNGPILNLAWDLEFLLPFLIGLGTTDHLFARLAHPTRARELISRIGTSAFMSAGFLLLGLGVIHFYYKLGVSAIVFASLLSVVRIHLVKEQEVHLDVLTRLPNRRLLDQTLDDEWHRHVRTGQSMALLMIDVDYFKLLNDIHGHHHGDQALRMIAKALDSCLNRSTDFVGRYGGEEFMAVLPATGTEGAAKTATRLCEAVAALHLSHPESPYSEVSISVGIACSHQDSHLSLKQLLYEVDRSLYRAKEQGRNCVDSTWLNTTAEETQPAG